MEQVEFSQFSYQVHFVLNADLMLRNLSTDCEKFNCSENLLYSDISQPLDRPCLLNPPRAFETCDIARRDINQFYRVGQHVPRLLCHATSYLFAFWQKEVNRITSLIYGHFTTLHTALVLVENHAS